ncbi:MAG: hypothetical protein R3C28_13015 [Pirellulaceae bacterium]
MTTIGQITVNVLANTKGFSTGMQKSRSELASLNTASSLASKSVGLLSKGMGLLGVTLTTGAVIGSLRKTANEMDHLAKTSDKLGIATERLVGLTHAANLSGVESGKLEMSLQRLTRRSAEAAQGTGEAVSALNELNIDAKAFNNLAPDQKMYRLADAFKGVKTQADRVRIAFKLFDSEGVDLVNTLAGGSLGLREMQAEAEKMGLTFDRKAAKNVEKFNDEMERLGSVTKGFKNSIVIDIAPAAAEAVEGLRLVMTHDSGRQKAGSLFMQNVGQGFNRVGHTAPILAPGWQPNERNSFQYRYWDSWIRNSGVAMGSKGLYSEAELRQRAARSPASNSGFTLDIANDSRIQAHKAAVEADRKQLAKVEQENAARGQKQLWGLLTKKADGVASSFDNLKKRAMGVGEAAQRESPRD